MANIDDKPRKNRPEIKPFYLASGTTSAEIVAEARTSVRCVETKRPCTPVESQRTLFGSSRRPESHSRPPSAFSIGPRHFTDPDDLPSPTSATHRLQPLANAPDIPDGPVLNKSDATQHVVVQADRKVKHNLTKAVDPLQPLDVKTSEDGGILPSPPKPLRPHFAASRRSSTGNIAKQKLGDDNNDTRRVHSGPTKRTSSRDNVAKPRVHSSPAAGRHAKEVSTNTKDLNENDRIAGETKKLSHLYKEHIRPILKEMDSNLRQDDGKSLCENCQSLLAMLRKVGILPETKAVETSSFKGQILKCLFSYLGIKNSQLHLRLSKIVLMFNLTENNEENIYKLLFKVSRDDNNDLLFLEEQVTDLLIKKVSRFAGNEKYEAWIYCVGALKLLSGNSVLRKTMVNSGCIEALGIVLRNIIKQNNTDVKLNKKNTNLLFPVTAVLRNLADVSGSRDLFLKKNILLELLSILKTFKTDSDVVMNICRILSKMTLYDECCTAVSSVGYSFETFLRVLSIHLKSQEIIVRVLFILGNLTTKSDETRQNLYFTKASTKYLLTVFQYYFEKNVQASKTAEGNETNAKQENTEDVLNKMVRVIANLSIHPEVGPEIAKNMEIVELLVQVLEIKDLTNNEELVLNTVATINNLSYYTEENTALATKRATITQLLMGLLVADNMDAILEASRVFGNFSRFKDVRDILSGHKVDEMMISLLDSGSHEIVYTSCGVLINMMVDCEKRAVLKEEGGIKKLIDVLRDFGKIDWQLGAMVCQTLWNYGENMNNVYETFGEEETIVLTDLLREYLDKETAFEYLSSKKIDPSVEKLLRETWKDNFELVGEQLLQKIESKQSDLLPLEDS